MGIATVALLGLGQLWRLPAMVVRGEEAQAILLDAVYFDGFAYGDKDEAVALRNSGAEPVDLAGWGLSNGGPSIALIPAGTWAAAGQVLWLTGGGETFAQQFGFAADVLMPRWPGFANHGDEVLLVAGDGRVVDTLVYGDGDTVRWAGQGRPCSRIPCAACLAQKGKSWHASGISADGTAAAGQRSGC